MASLSSCQAQLKFEKVTNQEVTIRWRLKLWDEMWTFLQQDPGEKANWRFLSQPFTQVSFYKERFRHNDPRTFTEQEAFQKMDEREAQKQEVNNSWLLTKAFTSLDLLQPGSVHVLIKMESFSFIESCFPDLMTQTESGTRALTWTIKSFNKTDIFLQLQSKRNSFCYCLDLLNTLKWQIRKCNHPICF